MEVGNIALGDSFSDEQENKRNVSKSRRCVRLIDIRCSLKKITSFLTFIKLVANFFQIVVQLLFDHFQYAYGTFGERPVFSNIANNVLL